LSDDKQVRLGLEAERLLKSEQWTNAWDLYRARVFTAIENAKTDEATIRGKLMLGVMTDVRQIFESLMKAGEYSTAQVKLEEERKKRRWPFAA
jgi:hypothetical protein